MWSTVAGADVELEHVDRQRDIPRRWRVYADALRLAETRGDWENVVLLMEGLADAGVRLRDEWLQKFVRAAAAKGQLQVVVRALQRAERTGVRLRSAAMVERVLWEVRGEASRAGWAQAETERAAVWAEQVVELMESREHCGGGVRVVKGDLRTLPFVIATPLELVAVRAVRHNEGVDEAGLVKAYAERLCANLKIYGAQVCGILFFCFPFGILSSHNFLLTGYIRYRNLTSPRRKPRKESASPRSVIAASRELDTGYAVLCPSGTP